MSNKSNAGLIRPENGRHVHFYPANFDPQTDQPLAAIVTWVHGDRLVNLSVFDQHGVNQGYLEVPLVQPSDKAPRTGPYCTWMPYTVARAQEEAAAAAA